MPCDQAALFPETPMSFWEPYESRFPGSFIGGQGPSRDKKWFNTNLGVFLIKSAGKSVICDTGLGPEASMFGNPGKKELLDDMKSHGADPGDVDTVFLTHLHGDHVGWNLHKDGAHFKPVFPKAKYAFGKHDWEHFTQPDVLAGRAGETMRRSVLPLEPLGALDLLTGERELAPGVTAIPTPGHTPGHMSLLISSKNERAVILGDLIGSAMQITETDQPYSPDTDGPMGRATRKRVIDMAERGNMTMIASHLPRPGWGKLVRFQGRRYWKGG